MSLVARVAIFFLSIHAVLGHSVLGEPRPMSANHCRLGGVPDNAKIEICPGPCDMRPLYRYGKVRKPRARVTYGRGQRVDIKYQRNNHGPGGFVRLSLVTIEQMMNKTAHAANAFHFGCWGDYTITDSTLSKKRQNGGFSLVGGDKATPATYYETRIVIPTCIPDGIYVLGWAWYGGVGGKLRENTAESPYGKGLFADYWSCAFVEISGGDPLTSTSRPVFVNGLEKFWPNGCNAANNRPGVCTYEPCRGPAKLQKPAEFESGDPPLIRQDNFMGPDGRFGGDSPLPTLVPDVEVFEDAVGALKDCQAQLKDPPEETERGDTNKVLFDLHDCRVKLEGMDGMEPLMAEVR